MNFNYKDFFTKKPHVNNKNGSQQLFDGQNPKSVVKDGKRKKLELTEAMDLPPQPPAIVQQMNHPISPSKYLVGHSLTNAYVVAATLWGEARGEFKREGIESLQAVLNVIMNRAKGDFSKAEDVALKRKQFSMWNNIANKEKYAMNVHNLKKSPEEEKIYNQIIILVDKARDGTLKDITDGATYYYNPKIEHPDWAKEYKVTTIIGNHVFLRPYEKEELIAAKKHIKVSKEYFIRLAYNSAKRSVVAAKAAKDTNTGVFNIERLKYELKAANASEDSIEYYKKARETTSLKQAILLYRATEQKAKEAEAEARNAESVAKQSNKKKLNEELIPTEIGIGNQGRKQYRLSNGICNLIYEFEPTTNIFYFDRISTKTGEEGKGNAKFILENFFQIIGKKRGRLVYGSYINSVSEEKLEKIMQELAKKYHIRLIKAREEDYD